MKAIQDKPTTLRTAVAEALVKADAAAVAACMKGETPKGAVIDIARSAGIFAAKRTADLIPYCHPLLLEHVSIDIVGKPGGIAIIASVTATAKTGVEMEALSAASVAALTVYDMLKPLDEALEITGIRLVQKRGGKSDARRSDGRGRRAAILITSDRCAGGKAEDTTGPIIAEALRGYGLDVAPPAVVPDDRAAIEARLAGWCEERLDLVVTSGGTGVGPRDATVEATRAVVEHELPGVAEALRAFGQSRTPYAMLSRGIAGWRGQTIIVNLPGSVSAVRDGLVVIVPAIFHAFEMIEGRVHP